jgi:hypothetical protein
MGGPYAATSTASAVAAAAAYAAWYGTGWGSTCATAAPYALNTIIEVVSGRNAVGWLTWAGSDAVTREVLDHAKQAAIHPWATHRHNGYTFKVDKYCRTYCVSGYLSSRPAGRVYGAIKPLVTATNDASGHLIGDFFGGPIAAYNIVGMTQWQNNSEGAGAADITYKRMETALKTLFHRPGCVWIEIDVRYPTIANWGAATRQQKLDFWRPSSLHVRAIAYRNKWLPGGASATYTNPHTLPGAGIAISQTALGFDNTPAVGLLRHLA